MPQPLDHVLALEPEHEGRSAGQLLDGWQQGRGAFGGLLLGLMVRAMDRSVRSPTRTLRSLSGHLPAPAVPGRFVIHHVVLRESNSVTLVRAEMHQDDGIVAHAVGLYAEARPSTPAWQSEPFAAPAVESLPEVPLPPGLAPVFTQHFEFHSVTPPFVGAAEPRIEGWVRPRIPFTLEPHNARASGAWLVVLADTYWSAAAARFDGVRPFATVQFNLDVHGSLEGLAPDAHFFLRGHAPAATEGYVTEQRWLYGPDGRLLAVNNQLFAIIK